MRRPDTIRALGHTSVPCDKRTRDGLREIAEVKGVPMFVLLQQIVKSLQANQNKPLGLGVAPVLETPASDLASLSLSYSRLELAFCALCRAVGIEKWDVGIRQKVRDLLNTNAFQPELELNED